jgi:hypothetical protein
MNRSRKSRISLRVLSVMLGLGTLGVSGAASAESVALATAPAVVVTADSGTRVSPLEVIWT